MNLIEQFNEVYPQYQAVEQKGNCEIEEKENEGKTGCFQKLVITGFDGWKIQRDFPKDASSFYQKAKTGSVCKKYDVLTKDCDGLLYCENGGKIDIYAIELKSSYNVSDIVKAKNQIVGSLLKLRTQMSLLQGFQNVNIQYKGIIVAYEANAERLDTLLKMTDSKANFCRQLYKFEKYIMSAEKCNSFWSPLACPDLTIQFIKVPGSKGEMEVVSESLL